MINNVKLIAISTPVIEGVESLQDLIAYQAKVSNPKGQLDLENSGKLLKYCASHGHWSIFEMGNMVVEITTTRDISRQILRHRSFSFQEYSQRYAQVTNFSAPREMRLQDATNRQNSIESVDTKLHDRFAELQATIIEVAKAAYEEALGLGIAKEQARVLLPEGLTLTTMTMSGSIRSWIHYIQLREGNGTQKEHAEIAQQCKVILLEQLPILKEILFND